MASAQLSQAQVVDYVRQVAPVKGLDPNAVLAVASQEGLGGGIGDSGTSFGPWQLHQGGALPSSVGNLGADVAQAWAWSQDGINYALDQMAGVAKGLTGTQAVTTIVTQFERPANPQAEIQGALASPFVFGVSTSGSSGSVPQPPNFPPGTQTPVTFNPSPTGGAGGGPSPVTVTGPTTSASGCEDWVIQLPGLKGPGPSFTLPGTRIFCVLSGFVTRPQNWATIGLLLLAVGLVIAGVVLYAKGEFRL